MESIKLKVTFSSTNGYVTQKIQGKTASSTHSERAAVYRLADKIITDRPYRVVFLGDIERGKSEWEIIPEATEAEKKAALEAYEKETEGKIQAYADTNGEKPEAMTAAERQAKSKAELIAQGGRIAKARLSPRANTVLEKLAAEHGGISQAIEWALLQHEQLNLKL